MKKYILGSARGFKENVYYSSKEDHLFSHSSFLKNIGSSQKSLAALGEFRRSWRVVFAAMVAMCVGGSWGYWFGVAIGPLSQTSGWSISAISIWSIFVVLGATIFAPLVGTLIDRIGVRPIALLSVVFLAAAFFLMSTIGTNIYILYIIAFIVGISGAGLAAYIRAVNSWFDAGRGMALGLTLSGIALGSSFEPRMMQAVIDLYGWRSGFVFNAVTILLAVPTTFFWLRERERSHQASLAQETGYSLGQALRLAAFWLLSAAMALYGLSFGGAMFHLVPFLTDGGLSRTEAAVSVGALGIAAFFGKIIIGFVIDWLSAPIVCCFLLLVQGIAFCILSLFKIEYGVLAIILIGFGNGGIIPIFPYCIARYFGMRHFGAIYGLFLFFGIIGALGPLLLSRLREISGDYSTPFAFSAALSVGGAALFYFLGRHPFLDAPEKLDASACSGSPTNSKSARAGG